MLISTQEPLSDEDILACFLPINLYAQQEYDAEEDFQPEVSEVLVKPNPSQLFAVIDTLMNYQ